MLAAEPKRDARDALRDLLDEEATQLELAGFFRDALSAKRRVRVSCPKCKSRHHVTLPDFTARLRAAESLLSEALGRAPVAEEPPSPADLDAVVEERARQLLQSWLRTLPTEVLEALAEGEGSTPPLALSGV